MGPLSSVDVNRLVVERVVLTGYPVRVHKRTTVVKRMFYNPEGPSITSYPASRPARALLSLRSWLMDGSRPFLCFWLLAPALVSNLI